MLSQIRSWFAGVRHRSQVERDMSDELAFHLQARTEHWIAQGLSSGEAARRARLEFGWRGGQVEDCRQARGLALWDDLRSAVRYAWRSLRGRPTFTILSVAILAVTIGANTAVFSVLDAVMFRMLPVEKPADLRELSWIEHPNDGWSVSYDGSMRPSGEGGRVATSFAYPVYAQIRDHTTVFSDLFLFTGTDVSLGVSGNEQRAVNEESHGFIL